MTDAEIVKVATNLTVTGAGATTEALANRFGVDVFEMTQRLVRLETQGVLISVALSSDTPGMGQLYWVRPGEAAMYFSRDRYDEFEERVCALAAWKGYALVTSDPRTSPRLRRYSIESTTEVNRSEIHGNRLERVLWKLRNLPRAGALEQPVHAASDVVAVSD